MDKKEALKSLKKSIITWLWFSITVFWVVYAASITTVTTQTINSWDSIGSGWFQSVNDKLSNIFSSNWNIGIWASNPTYNLQVWANSWWRSVAYIWATTENAYLNLVRENDSDVVTLVNKNDGTFRMNHVWSSSESHFVMDKNWNIWIWKTWPTTKLDVNWAIKIWTQSTCDSTTEWSIRYDSTNKVFEWCNWVKWQAFWNITNVATLSVSWWNNQKITLASWVPITINDGRTSWTTYGTLPDYLVWTVWTDKINWSAVTLTLDYDTKCYLMRQDTRNSVPLTWWTIKETNKHYMSNNTNLDVYEKILTAWLHTLDVDSAMYACEAK